MNVKKLDSKTIKVKCDCGSNCIATNEQGLWSGGGFETRPPERLPI
jgi:hypothetical protein